MEGVIGSLMDSDSGRRSKRSRLPMLGGTLLTPIPVTDIVKPPLLPQAKVNKCLIALVNRKVVEKETSKVRVLRDGRTRFLKPRSSIGRCNILFPRHSRPLATSYE